MRYHDYENLSIAELIRLLAAERDALRAENEGLRDICSRASAQFCTTIRGCADRELIRELDRAALNTGEQE